MTDSSDPGLTEDVLLPAGLERAVRLVLRLRVSGLLVLSPPCSSWIWMNSAKCKRAEENNFWGDVLYSKVREGNATAQRAIALARLAIARGAEVVIENPPVSVLWLFPPMMALIADWFRICTPRCAWSSGRDGRRYKKPYKFVATGLPSGGQSMRNVRFGWKVSLMWP